MSTLTVNGVTIHTHHDCPPIPVRDMDWSAVTNDYDADCDDDGYYSAHPIGTGPTEWAAVQDLLDQLAEQLEAA